MDKGEWKSSLMKYHFNIPLNVIIDHRNDHLDVWFYCKRNSSIPWSVQCAFQIQIVHPSGKTKSEEQEMVFKTPQGYCWYHFMKWEEMKKEYLVGDQLTVSVNVVINKITGICVNSCSTPYLVSWKKPKFFFLN
uniref:MATH domain-containing protein n=1 Tax=Caenorhabditis tropicalis TaxID=1561998 RepID=A0A1I7UTV3_9PELO